ncbi:hypothetical protein ACJJIL_18995 [Microbulbifer sp. EKSA005]|uniref:hypothetical protein n=1 Tax=Microbulbifer sp. EKSA005 TaxID=3243364 RepID=UPI0040431A2C
MKLVQWTLFIDMLGYRDINGAIQNEESAREFIDFMLSNREIFEIQNSEGIKQRYRDDLQFNLYEYYDIQHAFISDSLVITYYPKEVKSLTNEDKMFMHSANALFIILMRLQTFIFNCFSEKGIFLRGGISNGYCYLKDSFAVGTGLIDAYNLESKVAKYPRIALSPHVLGNEKLMERFDFINKKMYGRHKFIAQDSDGVSYLDYLTYNIATVDVNLPMVWKTVMESPENHHRNVENMRLFIRKHKEAIFNKIKELELKLEVAPEDEKGEVNKILAKFLWLKDYHNSVVSISNFDKHVL